MQLKLLSWNIWFNGYFDEAKPLLVASKADIIALQEVVFDDKTRDAIAYLTGLGYQYVFAPVAKLKEDGRTFGNAVFSKHKIASNQTHILSEAESRNAVQADIVVGDTMLHVFSTHLLHTHQKPSDIQALQAETLIRTVPPTHSVIMGDFNATPESAAVQQMEKVFVKTNPTSTPTWSVYTEGCPSVCRLDAVNLTLDYIFTTKDIKAHSFEVENSRASDHLPISVMIEI